VKNAFIVLLILAVLTGCIGGPSSASTKDELDIAIRDASDYLNKNIPHNSKIVILNVQSTSSDLSDYIIDELIANAVNDKIFSVVDRQQLDLIRAEQNFQLSGDVDDNEALAIGRFLGAQTIVSGAVRTLGSGYRITIRALEVQTTRVQGQYNRNIASSTLITDLLKGDNSAASATAAAATADTASRPAASANTGVTSMNTMQLGNISRGTASVPGAEALQFGSIVSGHIALGGEYWYSVRTSGSGFVVLETFSNIDTFLHAYDANLKELSTDDDSGDRYNARIELLASANQTYYFKLRGKESNHTTGAFRVMASFNEDRTGRGLPNTSRSQAAQLKLNEAIPINYSQPNECRWYFYEVPRYGTLTIFTEGNMDTMLYLYDRFGTLIAQDDDSGEDKNAKISRNLNAGIYFIDVCPYRRIGNTTLHAEFK